MNELTIRGADLPALPMEDIKQYVDVIGDAIDALKAKRNAAGHLNVDKAVVDEMDAQIREYSAMKLSAEMELGKKTAALEQTDHRYGNQHDISHPAGEAKKDRLKKIGVSSQRASDMERMAKHEEVVNRYIDHQLSIGETPTKAGAFRKIAETAPKPKTPKQAAEEHIKEIKAAPIASIQDAVTLREKQKTVDRGTADEVVRKIHNAVATFSFYCTDGGEDDFGTFAKAAHHSEIVEMVETINRAGGYLLKLKHKLEVYR